MNTHIIKQWIYILIVLYLTIGCSMHPQNMSDNEWNSLTMEQQTVELEHQRLVDKYNADVDRCHRESERTIKVKIPGGGMSGINSFGTSVGDIKIYQGEDSDKFSQCMNKEGWEITPHFLMQRILSTG